MTSPAVKGGEDAPSAGHGRKRAKGARRKAWLWHAVRAGIGALAIVLLVRTGALDPRLLAAAVAKHPLLLAAAFLLYLVPLQAIAWLRWVWLLRTAKVRIGLGATLRLQLTGLFFNGFLPGGTGGDLAKGWYLLRGRSRPEAAAALGTLVADRVTGLLGLVALAAAANLLNIRAWDSSPVLAAQALFILSLAGGLAVLSGIYLSPWRPLRRARKARPIESGPRGFLSEFASALGSLSRAPWVFLGAVGLSMGAHFLLVAVYALCAAALDVSLPFHLHAYVAPTLTLANGIPISPAGLGVGEAAGMILYRAVGATHGFAEIPALVHAIGLITALLASPAYLLRKR